MMDKPSSQPKDQYNKSVYKILNEHLNPEKSAQSFIKLNGIEAIAAIAKFSARLSTNAWKKITATEKLFLLGSIITFLFSFTLSSVRRLSIELASERPSQALESTWYELLFLLLFIVFTWSFFVSMAIRQSRSETATVENTFDKLEKDEEKHKDCVKKLSEFSKYELKSAKEQISLYIKSIQSRQKTSSSLLPLVAIALVIVAIDLLNVPVQSLTNNMFHGTVAGASGFVAIVLLGLKFLIDSGLQPRLILFERCLVILERALATKD